MFLVNKQVIFYQWLPKPNWVSNNFGLVNWTWIYPWKTQLQPNFNRTVPNYQIYFVWPEPYFFLCKIRYARLGAFLQLTQAAYSLNLAKLKTARFLNYYSAENILCSWADVQLGWNENMKHKPIAKYIIFKLVPSNKKIYFLFQCSVYGSTFGVWFTEPNSFSFNSVFG